MKSYSKKKDKKKGVHTYQRTPDFFKLETFNKNPIKFQVKSVKTQHRGG